MSPLFLIICNGACASTRGNLPTVVKIHTLLPLLLAGTALTFSCGDDSSPEGTYDGRLVMEDGIKTIRFELLGENIARARGLFGNVVDGTWEKDSVGVGYSKDGVLVSFEFEASTIVFKMHKAEDGFILAELMGQKKGMTILRPLTLKEDKPLLRRVD